jgi:hypothetical protein
LFADIGDCDSVIAHNILDHVRKNSFHAAEEIES